MKIYKKVSFLIIIALFGMSFVSIGNSYEDTEYLPFSDYTYYGVEMNIGDNLTWSFETYSEEFEVHVEIDGIDLSDGQTSDSGVWYTPNNGTFYILFVNMDTLLFRNGFIKIYFEVNVEPAFTFPNIILAIGGATTAVIVLAIIILIVVNKKKRRRAAIPPSYSRPVQQTVQQQEISYIYCSNCGNRVSIQKIFCTNCGQKLK